MKEVSEKVLENRLRRQATRLGLRLIKSRTWKANINDYGEWAIIDSGTNAFVCGNRFDMSLEEVAQWLKEYEENIRESRD